MFERYYLLVNTKKGFEMIERSIEEKTNIAIVVIEALFKEAATLNNEGKTSAVNAIVEYVASAPNESLIRLYDILRSE